VLTSVGEPGCAGTTPSPNPLRPENECYHRHQPTTHARARFTVAEHIDNFYDRQRLHSSLCYRTQQKPRQAIRPQPRPDQNQRPCSRSLTHPSPGI
jgi:hypothetical protein